MNKSLITRITFFNLLEILIWIAIDSKFDEIVADLLLSCILYKILEKIFYNKKVYVNLICEKIKSLGGENIQESMVCVLSLLSIRS